MTEPSTIRRDNPLFIRYGSLVERCFGADLPVGTPLSLFPAVGHGSQDERGGKKDLASHADPAEVAAAQRSVDRLRAALWEEEQGSPGGRSGDRETTRQLQEFRLGLQRGKEAMLEENPFYELAALFYRIHLTALKNGFMATQQEAAGNPPRPITVSRSYRHIWSSDSAVTSLRQKGWESLGKVGSLGKWLIGLLLFAGSTVTTAKGVIDLVQLPSFVALFGDGLAGSAHESARTTFAVVIGFALSSVILDFKSHLFRGVAEVGKVWQGLFHAWRRHPRWVTLATFLTLISIWTNYDGIVLLTTKTGDLAHQWLRIEQQVNSALGDAHRLNPDQPGSLRDLRAALHKKAADAIAQFRKVPEDERAGAASSGVASAGPRYWAKRFIIEGGYQPVQNDVARLYKSTPLTSQIDTMLKRSGLDLTPSLEAKIRAILNDHEVAFRHSEAAVQNGMAALSGRMTLQRYSLAGLTTLFNLESYHINAGVQEIVAHLEENKNAFARAAQAIRQLTEGHIALLREVDKVGTPVNNSYTIAIPLDIPRLEAIEQLKQGGIPLAKRRNLVELKELLLERYGLLPGGAFLFFILFLAVFMDLSDPILYTAMVARWGRRDRHFLEENVSRLRAWEENHLRHLHRFLVRADVLALLPRLPTPKYHLFHHIYNHFLEEVEPRSKDPASRAWWERGRFWFLGLFSESRIEHVEGYNARQTALLRCLREAKILAPQALNRLFPGLLDPIRIGVDHFDTLFEKIHTRMKQDERAFELALSRHGPEAVADDPPGWLYTLFGKPLLPPPPSFPLTRINQVRALALSRYQSRSHISQLADFVPALHRFVRGRLYGIQKNLLLPMAETLAKIPNGGMLVTAFRIQELEAEYRNMEQGLLELLGLSQFQGIPIDEPMVQTIVAQSGIDEIAGIFLRQDTPESAMDQRIDTLEFRLARAYKLIRDLVSGQDTLIFTLTRIRREYLSPINTALSRLQSRDRVEEALGLRKMREDFSIIEQCLLELWDPSVQPMALEPGVGSAGLGAIIHLIRRNSAIGQAFDLIVYVKQLELRMAEVHKQLDAALYSLTLVDRIGTNVLQLLDSSVALVGSIVARDEACQTYPVAERIIHQKKFDFLEENRLFFRTVSLQVEALRTRINTLDMGSCLLGSQGLDLAREVEKQAILLRYFLKNALDFLEDRRDAVGLTAALAELQPRLRPAALQQRVADSPPGTTQPPPTDPEGEATPAPTPSEIGATPAPTETGATPAPTPTAAVANDGAPPPSTAAPDTGGTEETLPEPPTPREEEDASAPLPSAETESLENDGGPVEQVARQIRALCDRARQVLLEMSLWEWDLLKKPVPPPDLLHVIQGLQPAVDKNWLAVEGVQVTLEGLHQWHEGHLEGSPALLSTLEALRQQAEEALEQLYAHLDQISLPPHVDRRSKVAVTRHLKKRAAQRRAGEEQSPSQRMVEDSSRRVEERVAVQSRIEVLWGEAEAVVGATRDVNARGFCLEVERVPAGIRDGMAVRFRVLSDPQRRLFFGKLFRTSGTLLVVLLEAGYETLFLTAIRTEVLQERPEGAGILHMTPAVSDGEDTVALLQAKASVPEPPSPTHGEEIRWNS
ncbi:MAG: hypothetical protein H7837_12305 [Magnetococcus sp. MYC-9]